MSDNLKKSLVELKRAMSYKSKNKRKNVLDFLSNKKTVYKALREISKNIKRYPLNKRQKNKLNKEAKLIISLKKGTKIKSKQKRLVQQSGGFLPWLIPIVATLLTSIT